MLKVETIYGNIETYESDLIGDALRKYGEWARIETQFVAALICENKLIAPCFYDIGAFLGTFSMGLRIALQERALLDGIAGVAVEADPTTAATLCRNLAGCAGGQIRGVPGIVGFAGSRRERRLADNNIGGTRYVAADNRGQVANTEADSCTPLRLLREKFGAYGLLKVDVEGMEREVIQSDIDWIKMSLPIIYAECNEAPESLELFKLLKAIGYQTHYFAFPAFNRKNFRRSREDMFSGAYEAAIVAVPPGARIPNFERMRCIQLKINNQHDLARSLWFTPRWIPPLYRERSFVQLLGAVGKLAQGIRFEDYEKVLRRDLA